MRARCRPACMHIIGEASLPSCRKVHTRTHAWHQPGSSWKHANMWHRESSLDQTMVAILVLDGTQVPDAAGTSREQVNSVCTSAVMPLRSCAWSKPTTTQPQPRCWHQPGPCFKSGPDLTYLPTYLLPSYLPLTYLLFTYLPTSSYRLTAA